MSAKRALNDKLQGSVAAYFKTGEYLAKLQAKTWLSRALSPSFSSVLARRVWCPRDWHCCRCMRRTHAASWFFQSRVALSTSVPALRSLAVRSQSRTTSSLHVGVARRLRQLVLAHRVCSCQHTNQISGISNCEN